MPPREAIVAGVGDWAQAEHGVGMLGSLGFENAYAFAMRGEDARRRGIAALTDLAAQAPGLDLATDVEFLERPEWRAVRDAYGLRFKSARPYQPTFMYRALASGSGCDPGLFLRRAGRGGQVGGAGRSQGRDPGL